MPRKSSSLIKYKRKLSPSPKPHILLALLLLGIGSGIFIFWLHQTPKISPTSHQATIEIAFGADCASLITKAIQEATQSIHVSAYTFKLETMIDALLAAKKRSVTLHILLDKGEYDKFNNHYKGKPLFHKLQKLKTQADEMYVYDKSYYTHDKITIIDHKHTATGSFNYKEQRQEFEDLIYLKNDPQVGEAYKQHWEKSSDEKGRRIPIAAYDRGKRYKHTKKKTSP